jgi:hypothetical protein
MPQHTVIVLVAVAVLLWCLIGTLLLNRIPLLSDPRLHTSIHHRSAISSLLVVIVLITFWPAGKSISAWLTSRARN